MIGGTLQGIETLCRACPCGRKTHEPVVGKDRSRRSAFYPRDFCVEYGKLAAKHFMNVAKAEFLEGRLMLLERRIGKARRKTRRIMRETEDLDSHTEHMKSSTAYRKGLDHKLNPRSPSGDPSVDWSVSSEETHNKEEGSSRRRSRSRSRRADKVELKGNSGVETSRYISLSSPSSPASTTRGPKVELKPNMTWKGGHGRHGTLKEPRAKTDVPKALVYVGGMRDPHKAVTKLPTLQEHGNKMWERWRKFVPSHASALQVAETYGTEDCQFDEDSLQAWRKELCDLWKIEVPPEKASSSGHYTSPVHHEMLAAWVKASGDPDGVVVKWLKEGAPLGIEKQIETAGIFPPSEEAETEDVRDHVVGDAVLARPESLKNYKSVEDEV